VSRLGSLVARVTQVCNVKLAPVWLEHGSKYVAKLLLHAAGGASGRRVGARQPGVLLGRHGRIRFRVSRAAASLRAVAASLPPRLLYIMWDRPALRS